MKDISQIFEEEETKTLKDVLKDIQKTFSDELLDTPTELALLICRNEDGQIMFSSGGNNSRGVTIWEFLGMLEWAKMTVTERIYNDEDEDDD